MMPVIRVSDETYARLKKHAQPFEDTPESIIVKALAALEMMDGELPMPASAPVKRSDAPKLPQKEFRLPLLMTLLKFGGKAQAKEVRGLLGIIVATKLSEGDYESVSTGDPRWWNAACWERSELVKDGFMRDDSDRGVWEISESGKKIAAVLHDHDGHGGSHILERGPLHHLAAKYWQRPSGSRPFIAVGDAIFDPIMLRPVDELELSVRSANCLKNDNILYVGDLVQRSIDDLLRVPNFGRKSVNEINEVLGQLKLKIGMTLPGGPMLPFDGDTDI